MTGLFEGRFDDAALFPPADAPMTAAVPGAALPISLIAATPDLPGAPGVLGAAVATWPTERAARARAGFTSSGTCSVLEPVDDLVALGLLPSRIPA